MSEREASLPEYIIMLGNSDHRAAQEYCDLIRKCEKQAAEIERLSEKEVATWQTNQAQARENTQQAKRIKAWESAARKVEAGRWNVSRSSGIDELIALLDSTNTGEGDA